MGAADKPVLTLVCPYCGKAFASAMQIDPAAFESMRIENMLEHCSACLRASRFNKDDYFFVTDDGQT